MLRRLWETIRTNSRRAVVRNLVGLLLCTGISQLCNFGILLLAARQLGTDALGIFLFALAVQNYLLHLGGVGAGPALVREVTARREQTDEFIASYLLLVISATTLVTVSAFAVLVFAAPAHDERLMWIWILVGNLASSLNLLPMFDAHHRQALAGIVSALSDMLTLCGFVWATLTDQLDLVLAGRLMALKWGAICGAQLLLFVRTVRPIRWVWRADTVRLFLRSGVLVLVAYLLLLAPLNGGVVLVRLLLPEAEAATATAILGIAAQMAAVHLQFCMQTARIFQPHITGPNGLERWFVRRLILAYGGITLALTAGAAIFGSVVITWFLPPAYSASVLPLVLLLIGSLLLAIGFVESLYLHRFHRERAIFLSYGASAIVFLVDAVWLIPIWGLMGACLAMIAAGAVSAVLMAILLGVCARAVSPGTGG